jgi:cytochrome c-type biogenesis protein
VADPALPAVVAFAVTSGVATFFAPCAYPLLPGYVGYYLGEDDATLSGAVVRGSAAAVGALVVLGGIAGVVLTLGQRLVRNLALVEPVVGALLVVLGVLYVTGRAPDLSVALPQRRASVAGFGLFGGVYALAAAGCVVPLFLGVVSQSLTLPPASATVALGSYAAAVALPLFGVTLLAAVGSDALRGVSKHVGSIQRVAGVVMVLAGLGQIALSLSLLGIV